MRHPVQAFKVVRQCLTLRHSEHVTDVCQELHNALGGLVRELHVFNPRGL